MAKIKLQYKTAEMVNPSTKTVVADKRRPHIVGLRIYNLDELVRFALDNNYIEGAKYELAKGIVKGAIEAERALVLAGNAVSVDGWMKYEPRLKGSVSAKTRQLSAKDNQLILGISALKELKLSLSTFSWQLVDEGFKPEPEPTDAPTATSWVADGMEGEPIDLESSSLKVNGTKLAGATKVQFMYSEDGAVFDSADVGEATDTSVTAQCGFTGTPTQSEGFLRVVTPNGTTNSIPCTFRR